MCDECVVRKSTLQMKTILYVKNWYFKIKNIVETQKFSILMKKLKNAYLTKKQKLKYFSG